MMSSLDDRAASMLSRGAAVWGEASNGAEVGSGVAVGRAVDKSMRVMRSLAEVLTVRRSRGHEGVDGTWGRCERV